MNFRQAVSTKKDGNMSYLWGEATEVLDNRRNFLESTGFDIKKCVTVHTSDSNLVQIVTAKDKGRGMFDIGDAIEADAIATNEKGLGLFLVVADCAATVMFDPKKQALALVHLNGKNPDLIASVISEMEQRYGTNAADIKVQVSPAINKASFVVPDSFQRESAEWEPYVVNLDEHLSSIDMLGFLTAEMVKSGILKANISISDIDTYASVDYFSHRRSAVTGEKEGRFAVVAEIV